MITVATLLWEPNADSYTNALAYNESWVEKLYRGFKRNLSRPFRFVVFTDYEREFAHPEIEQELLPQPIGYHSCIEPYRLNEPMILVGLDTVITGNCDNLADYCLSADVLAVPRDPIFTDKVCNGVALVPAGQRARMYDAFDGRNDMDWIRANPHQVIDDLFPGQVMSYRVHVRAERRDTSDMRICYFHGALKAHELPKADPVRMAWA